MRNEKLEQGATMTGLEAARDELRGRIADILFEIDGIRFHINPQLEVVWATKIGVFALLDQEAEFSMRCEKRKLELLQRVVNRGEEVDESVVEEQLQIELSEWEEHITELRRITTDHIAEYGSGTYLTNDEENELKSLYRTICKRMHPDLAVDLTPAEKSLFLSARHAYKNGDLTKMRAVEASTRHREKVATASPSADAVESLNLEISLLQTTYSQLEKRLAHIVESFPYAFADRLADPAWVAEQVDGHNARIAQYQKMHGEYRARVAGILTGAAES